MWMPNYFRNRLLRHPHWLPSAGYTTVRGQHISIAHTFQSSHMTILKLLLHAPANVQLCTLGTNTAYECRCNVCHQPIKVKERISPVHLLATHWHSAVHAAYPTKCERMVSFMPLGHSYSTYIVQELRKGLCISRPPTYLPSTSMITPWWH